MSYGATAGAYQDPTIVHTDIQSGDFPKLKKTPAIPPQVVACALIPLACTIASAAAWEFGDAISPIFSAVALGGTVVCGFYTCFCAAGITYMGFQIHKTHKDHERVNPHLYEEV